MNQFLSISFIVLAASLVIAPPAQAGAIVKFDEAFGMPTPFSVGDDGQAARNIVRGVPAALQPWWVKRGEAKVEDNGKISARVDYLVFAGGNFIGTTGPITQVILTLFCGEDQFSTDPVPLEEEGMIRVRKEPLMPIPPAVCEDPALLVRIANPVAPWIAAFALEE